ncbi:MAG: transposase [Chlamydiales bacterium]|nr:transposase [Chlamydiales bacterium]
MHDGKALGLILNQVPRSCRKVLADGAYDGKAYWEMINLRGATALIPSPKNARIHHQDEGRSDAVRIMRALGRSLWGKLTGYSQRSLVEAPFSPMKKLFGSQLFSRRIKAQRVEN